MRTEQQMFDLILATARDDDRIRAVIMNGSRANPSAPRDFFQDYDIVYVVTDVEPFRHNLTWIARFGELMILQLPDEMEDPPPVDAPGFAYLMQFADAAIQMIHKIARRDGIGSVLAEGVKRAAEQIGRGAERYAMHVKGQELPMHEPRGKVGVGLAYAISPTGADHMEADHDPSFESLGIAETGWEPLGLLEPVDRFDLGPDKVRAFKYAQTTFNLYNSIGMCDFVGVPINALRLEMLRDYINGATGWDMSLFEMMKVGERANTMYRLFNLREGFTAADDTLPDRLFEGLNNGHLQGRSIDREEFRRALQLYYGMSGWNGAGVPTAANLAELGLTWAAQPTAQAEVIA